jgi:hypothetical protein
VSGHWEAAVAQGVADLHDDYLIEESCDAMAMWATPKEATETVLTAALPHLRRHIIAELREKAEAEAGATGTIVIDGVPIVNRAAMAARWLAAQEATDE